MNNKIHLTFGVVNSLDINIDATCASVKFDIKAPNGYDPFAPSNELTMMVTEKDLLDIASFFIAAAQKMCEEYKKMQEEVNNSNDHSTDEESSFSVFCTYCGYDFSECQCDNKV